jgi:hypothetical protein
MTAIKTNFGEGGRNLQPRGVGGDPTLADTLRDVADDLASVQSATIASADAAPLVVASADAATLIIASPDAFDLPSTMLLVNEIKTALNAQTDVFDLANEIKAALNAISVAVLKTTKA